MEDTYQILEEIRQLFLSLDPSKQAAQELETQFEALIQAVNRESKNDNSEDDDDYMNWLYTIIYLATKLGASENEDDTKVLEDQLQKVIQEVDC